MSNSFLLLKPDFIPGFPLSFLQQQGWLFSRSQSTPSGCRAFEHAVPCVWNTLWISFQPFSGHSIQFKCSISALSVGATSTLLHFAELNLKFISLIIWLIMSIHSCTERSTWASYTSGFFFFLFLKKLIHSFILLYNIVLVLPYIDLNPPWVYMCFPSWTPLPLPSPLHPSGSSQCTSFFSHLYPKCLTLCLSFKQINISKYLKSCAKNLCWNSVCHSLIHSFNKYLWGNSICLSLY